MPARGYRWWYVDATSSDEQHHLVVIAFVGSVFSPFYARACAGSAADPDDYCALNVGLYGPRSRHTWVFTEFRRDAVARAADEFALGHSRLRWQDGRLHIDVDERSAPLARNVRGEIVVTPVTRTTEIVRFGAGGRHGWWPAAPTTEVDVQLDSPSLAWQGRGYSDTNFGAEPLHEGFDDWCWCRWHDGDKARIQYRARATDGTGTALDLSIGADGEVRRRPLPNAERLPASGWRIAREWYPQTAGGRVGAIDDTPFYARSLLWPQSGGRPLMHESLDLARFRAGWVRRLLPFRMRFPPARLLG